ncbi:MAG: YcxB family protein [Bacteroidales bacterium]|jgi:hypothetical protein|nr:YcxB family protein [Bacteroidales bacterium]
MNYQTTYLVTEDLIISSVKQTFFKVYLKKKWIIILCFYLLSALGFIFAEEPKEFDYTVSFAVLAFALLMSLIWVKSYFSSLSNARSAFKLSGEGLMDMCIDGATITITSNAGSRKVDLGKITKVIETKDYLVLMLDKLPIFTPLKRELSDEAISYLKASIKMDQQVEVRQ